MALALYKGGIRLMRAITLYFIYYIIYYNKRIHNYWDEYSSLIKGEL